MTTEPYILIEIVSGLVENIQHTLPAPIKTIIQTSDDSVLDASLTTMHVMPATPSALNADIADVVRLLANAYQLPGWAGLTDQAIVAKLLTGDYDMNPSEDGQNLAAAIAAMNAGHKVFYEGCYPVDKIQALPNGTWEIDYYNDPEDTSLGTIITCPGDITADDLVFTITANDTSLPTTEPTPRAASPAPHHTRRIEILRVWENNYWDTAFYTFDLAPGQDAPDQETILKVVSADAFDIVHAAIWNLEAEEEDDEEDEGDDMCDYCMRSNIQISHTLNGKTICDACLADRTPDPDYEPVELDLVEIQVTALQAAKLLRATNYEDLDMRYNGYPVTALSIHIGATTDATLFYNTVIGNFDTQHEVAIPIDQPVIYVTVPKE